MTIKNYIFNLKYTYNNTSCIKYIHIYYYLLIIKQENLSHNNQLIHSTECLNARLSNTYLNSTIAPGEYSHETIDPRHTHQADDQFPNTNNPVFRSRSYE
ncbi:hypothetical protein PUN28_003122 [Cardiocondyla obscurior]|uniref:Uncharacterized protein n=1 Tax=Cardiocondyla obscurior TaxID=286306 RepID=A0AAW2GLU5_9HYME